ncbi:MAG: TldD/PmbA family protein [Candidatus Tectomicrobia bacterium]|nr:TldD/PmbA family protein [Candidatus Tectomicrobia bacterium]
MIALDELQGFARDGLARLRRRSDVEAAELFVAANEQLIARLNYTSDIPCNGVHEPKSSTSFGVGVLAVFRAGTERRLGFGSEVGSLTPDGLDRAVTKAARNAVLDPDFHSLPQPPSEAPRLVDYHDPQVMALDDETLVDLGWQALSGAVLTYKDAGFTQTLIVNGDVTVLRERMAIVSTTGIDVADESTILMATITSMIEREQVKGTGWSLATHLAKFTPRDAGAQAAQSAINTIGGVRLPSGGYAAVLGRQAVTELVSNLLVPSLSLDVVDAKASPFCGRLGERVASPCLSLYDDGALPGEIASKKVTCEGLPTGRTDLIEEGRLVGFLADHYTSQKLRSPVREFAPRNGFRFNNGRDFRRRATVFPTNVVVCGHNEAPPEALLAGIERGVYVGRLWYTYPIHGLGPGDFTGTIVGDSYLIEGGKLSRPVKPNTLRVNDNFLRLFNDIVGISRERHATLVWGSEESVLAPEIAVGSLALESIAQFLA